MLITNQRMGFGPNFFFLKDLSVWEMTIKPSIQGLENLAKWPNQADLIVF